MEWTWKNVFMAAGAALVSLTLTGAVIVVTAVLCHLLYGGAA